VKAGYDDVNIAADYNQYPSQGVVDDTKHAAIYTEH